MHCRVLANVSFTCTTHSVIWKAHASIRLFLMFFGLTSRNRKSRCSFLHILYIELLDSILLSFTHKHWFVKEAVADVLDGCLPWDCL